MTNTVTTNYPHIKINVGPVVAAGSGLPGASAYDIWLAAGNTGTEADFLTSLAGGALDADQVAETVMRVWFTPAERSNLVAALNRTADGEQRWSNLFEATEEAWSPSADYDVTDVVMHAGAFWIATGNPAVAAEPGVAPMTTWAPLTMESLFREIVMLRQRVEALENP